MPMVMITGQKGILASRQARFQIVDMVAAMKPLTKLAHQIVGTGTIPTLVREAFRVAREERPARCCSSCPKTSPARSATRVAPCRRTRSSCRWRAPRCWTAPRR
jgi:acetolactate synthase-1/2/3 large subunit